jgi:pSer/pThr/pTyr-binding forkhead associated (FHA) protein
MTMTWKLQAISGELEGQEVTIDRDMLVGRHQDADLLLQSAEISRRHAAFLLKDDALWVQDLKSSNGTFVNDIRIDQDKMLMDGDIVQFASIKFNVLAPVKAVEVADQSIAEPTFTTRRTTSTTAC